VEFEAGQITLEKGETKNDDPRSVPILEGDMMNLLLAAKKERDEQWPDSPWIFNRQGEPIKDFRWSWDEFCKRAGVPDLNFHDLRCTAVRNMRRDGVPQVVRMKISGHKTDSIGAPLQYSRCRRYEHGEEPHGEADEDIRNCSGNCSGFEKTGETRRYIANVESAI
jgi:integrase